MVKIAAIPFTCHVEKELNVRTATRLIRQAAAQGAQVLCLPELFNTIRFCVQERSEYFEWAELIPGPTINRLGELARETGTLLVCPILERTVGGKFYNSPAVVGPDRRVIGKYRKASIPFMDRSRRPQTRGNG